MFNILFLYLLVKLTDQSESFVMPAVIYGVGAGILSIIFDGLSAGITTGLIAFAFAFIFFWLLHRFKDSPLYWVVLVIGVAVFFI
jgi:hypothetical protein